jgi:acetyl/propionyl-CoA carboxylase alpha subunit
MITSLLIANRGEIARRIIRTARRLGVRTVAVYSDADAGAPHVSEADQAVRLGPAPARESYLLADAVLSAARASGVEAIHPGYGFLSENAAFAEAVVGAGLVWVGPPPAAIRAMGLKDAAKSLMAGAGVPVTPGYLGDDHSPERLEGEAGLVGYPVLIKAVAGGGGKGMRKVERAEDFAAALASCRREAASSFGDDRVLIEKYVNRPRHIEVQVFGDRHGHVVHLFERDCSLQRRHQKVIEEAPAPGMDAATRAAVTDAALKAAKAVSYEGAGTVEFIADASEGLRSDRIWFMEMNTRLQVEHPVTEAITGLDLVEWQLRVASGEPLPLTQEQITMDGWAMEARLYAENPAGGFLPSTGPLKHFRLPTDGVRADSAVEQGGEVTPFYDPMIAKLIVHRPTRAAAAAALSYACAEVQVWPVKTNAGFLSRCAGHPDFVAGAVDTGFIEARLGDLLGPSAPPIAAMDAAVAALLAEDDEDASPWAPSQSLAGFRMGRTTRAPVRLSFGGSVLVADIPGDLDADVVVDDGVVVVFEAGEAFAFSAPKASGSEEGAASDGAILSPMPGKIISVAVKAGESVAKGQALLVMEAMKMEHAMIAPFAGVVSELAAVVGAQVAEGVVLVRLEPDA